MRKTKLPRIPGCKYAPALMDVSHKAGLVSGTHFQVGQCGFWMDSRIMGPIKGTREEAITAWRRMVRAMKKRFSTKDNKP